MYKLTVFIPNAALEPVKLALFAAGAGTLGNYEQCCWQVQGTGQFMPLVGSNPNIGAHDKLETVEEWRVEMVVADADSIVRNGIFVLSFCADASG